MIDTESRRSAALLVRRFVAGQISNFEFEDTFPKSRDRALRAVESTMWCFYDDFQNHKLKGVWKLNDHARSAALRWIVFLYSTEDYVWPSISFPGIRPIKLSVFGKLLGRQRQQRHFLESGDINFWPFLDSESYKQAKRQPVLLSGTIIAKTITCSG